MDKISIARGFTFSVRLFKWKAQQKLCFTYCDLDRIDSFGLNMKRRQYVSIYIYIRSISLVFIGLILYDKYATRKILNDQLNSRNIRIPHFEKFRIRPKIGQNKTGQNRISIKVDVPLDNVRTGHFGLGIPESTIPKQVKTWLESKLTVL